jgi:hypothetical protein
MGKDIYRCKPPEYACKENKYDFFDALFGLSTMESNDACCQATGTSLKRVLPAIAVMPYRNI